MIEVDRPADSQVKKSSYEAASAWVRSCNSYIWELARIFVPLSMGSAVLAINPTGASHRLQLCVASISLAAFWWFVAIAYTQSTVRARRVLVQIERTWGLDNACGHYTNEGQLAHRLFGVYACLCLHAVILAVLWILILCNG